MKPQSTDKIADLLNKLVKLLDENNEPTWATHFERLLRNYLVLTPDLSSVAPVIETMRGESHSFFELLLFKNNQPLLKENHMLEKLRNDLYKACLRLIEQPKNP